MKSKYAKAKSILSRVTNLLLEKDDFLLYRPMWEELHDRMVYYYDYRNKVNLTKKTPLFSGTLHNEAVVWWLKLKQKGHLSSTLLHFDTHDDMGLPDTKKNLLTARGKLNSAKVENGSCGLISWPVTCLLLSEGVDNVVWCMPSWVYDTKLIRKEQALIHDKKHDDFLYRRRKGGGKDKYRMKEDVELVATTEKTKEMDFHHEFEFSRLKVVSTKGWHHLAKLIGDENKYILDIDLDFFVTNGGKHSKTAYQREFEDLESTGRVHETPGITTPRAAYEDPASQRIVTRLNKEFSMIKKRVKVFLQGVAYLKKKGFTPCCITISDSTPTFFSGNSSRAVWTNSYTPKYFVPALRYLLTKGLANY